MHLRVVVGFDQEEGLMKTITASEPIISDAAADILMAENEMRGWPGAIQTLQVSLLAPGLLDKGLKGEVYARLIWILTRDHLLAQDTAPVGIRDCFWSRPFSVLEFLRTLLPEDEYNSLIAFRHNRRSTRSSGVAPARLPSFFEALASATANMNHFTSTTVALTAADTPDLLHDLSPHRPLAWGVSGYDSRPFVIVRLCE